MSFAEVIVWPQASQMCCDSWPYLKQKRAVGFQSFGSPLQSASLSHNRTVSSCFWYTILSFDVPWRHSKILFAPCIWAVVRLSMKRDRILTPFKTSGRTCLARNRSDFQSNFGMMLLLSSHLCHSLLTNFSLTVGGIFRGLQLLMPCFFNKSYIFCSCSIPYSPGVFVSWFLETI